VFSHLEGQYRLIFFFTLYIYIYIYIHCKKRII
jgi:hypothetical protein